MRTMLALSACCAAALFVTDAKTPTQTDTKQVTPVSQKGSPAPAQPAAAKTEVAAPVAAKDEAKEPTKEAASEAKPGAKKRSAGAAKKVDADKPKSAKTAKTESAEAELKALKKSLAQARRDRTALNKKIAELEKQLADLDPHRDAQGQTSQGR